MNPKKRLKQGSNNEEWNQRVWNLPLSKLEWTTIDANGKENAYNPLSCLFNVFY